MRRRTLTFVLAGRGDRARVHALPPDGARAARRAEADGRPVPSTPVDVERSRHHDAEVPLGAARTLRLRH